MTSSEGGFYSSIDADSEGEEGKFYVWTWEEVESTLGSEAAIINAYYNITQKGNWEEKKNILYIKHNDNELIRTYNLSASELQNLIDKSRESLKKVRKKRIRPGLDDKILRVC